jgi:hypothetical protein
MADSAAAHLSSNDYPVAHGLVPHARAQLSMQGVPESNQGGVPQADTGSSKRIRDKRYQIEKPVPSRGQCTTFGGVTRVPHPLMMITQALFLVSAPQETGFSRPR